jgi:hypothetical protein
MKKARKSLEWSKMLRGWITTAFCTIREVLRRRSPLHPTLSQLQVAIDMYFLLGVLILKCCFARRTDMDDYDITHISQIYDKFMNVKLIRYQFRCTRCAFRLIKSCQWYSGRKSWNPKNCENCKRAEKTNSVLGNWAKSVEG